MLVLLELYPLDRMPVLQILHLAHGLLGALDAAPAPAGPQALFAEDEAPRYINVNS